MAVRGERAWALGWFPARATRGLGRPSLDARIRNQPNAQALREGKTERNQPVATRIVPCLILVAMIAGLTACAETGPVLRSNKHLQLTGKEAARQDIEACEEQAERAGLHSGVNRTSRAIKGGVLGAIVGAVGGASTGLIGGGPGVVIGAAVGGGLGLIMGTAGGAYGQVTPEPPYADAVVRCLIEKGYEVSGWQ